VALAVFKTVGRASRGGRSDSCLFRMKESDSPHPPAVGALLERPEIAAFFPILSRPLVLRSVRAEVDYARARAARPGAEAAGGAGPELILDEAALAAAIASRLAALARRRTRRVLNGTGVLLHTNLGRSPLGRAEWEAAAELNTGYSNLEFDLASGERGRRGYFACELAALAAGAESAILLNNNAGALLLALRALASGREVLVSRGEQIQIGGGFRIPEILALSGARLVEVGTTNVTTVRDYLDAIGPETACILSVHLSNFAMRGFASRPSTAELAAALPRSLPLIHDQGSGCMEAGLPGELPVRRALRDGASLVCFSGDKLLGGPQAGIAAGRAELVSAMGRDPLFRALRPGKTVLSLLEERLVRALNGEDRASRIPEREELSRLGQAIRRRLPKESVRLVDSSGATGGGSSPDETFPSLALEPEASLVEAAGGADKLAARLREGSPPLVPAMREGRLLVDLAALAGEEPALLARLLREALGLESQGD